MNVVYSYIYGTNEEYYTQARNLFESIKKNGSTAHRVLFADSKAFDNLKDCPHFDQVILKNYTNPLDQKNLKFKFDVLETFGKDWDNSIWLDTDMYCFMNMDNLFNLLERFDLLWSPAHGREGRNKDKDLVYPEIPDDFPHPNAGLIGLNNKIYKKWCDLYFNQYDKYPEEYSYLESEQQIMRKVLWENKFNSLLLPEEYNFNDMVSLSNWGKNKWIAKPKIFHYTLNKHNYPEICTAIEGNFYNAQKG